MVRNYEATGRYDEALATCKTIRDLAPPGTDLWADAAIVGVYAGAGRRDEAQKILDDWMARADRESLGPMEVASMYAALGHTDQALEWLTQAHEDRYPGIGWLKVAPYFDPLRSDPRFQDLLRRMNFPQ